MNDRLKHAVFGAPKVEVQESTLVEPRAGSNV